MKLMRKMTLVATFALLVHASVAYGAPNEAGVVASAGSAIDNYGFDASGNAPGKVITNPIGVIPDGVPNFAAVKTAIASSNGILYHNGIIMTAGIKVNIVWYGNWSNTQKGIIKTMINGLNNSSYYNINSTYNDSTNLSVLTKDNNGSPSIYVGTETNDTNYSQSKTLSDAKVWTLAKTNLAGNNGITLVLTDGSVKESSGFLTRYCGWHYWGSAGTYTAKYAFIGNPLSNRGCNPQTAKSPNGDTGVDAMISVIAHEIVEAATDPDGKGWFDSNGAENADKCAWTFGTSYSASNGSLANMKLGGKDYYIQQNWVNASGGYCALGY